MTEVIEIPQISPESPDEGSIEENSKESLEAPKPGGSLSNNPVEEMGGRKRKQFKFSLTSRKRKVLKIFGASAVILLLFSMTTGLLFFRIYKKALPLQDSIRTLTAVVEEQDLPKIKTELINAQNKLSGVKGAYKTISWMKFLPFLGSYIEDGEHGLKAATFGLEAADTVIVAIEPYADIIGFAGDTADEPGSGQETTQERLDFVIKTIPDVIPKADELSEKVGLIQQEVAQIDPDRYPITFAGKEVRAKIQKGKELIKLGAQLVTNGKPLLEQAPYILGSEEARTYLILFQNDKELRPTGGFITAYSIATVEKGKFKAVSSNDIYNLDKQYRPTVPAPTPIVKYLKGPYLLSKKLKLRDLNWPPDFSQSMELFVKEIESVGIRDIDGVIAVDTQLLVNLLDVLGPIGVSGFGNYSTEIVPGCNCPQVIYELESFADVEGPVVWSQDEPDKIIFAPANIDNRKKIIGPLMNSILANALGQPKDKLPALFEAAFKSLMEKHVLFYLVEDKAQEGVEGFKIGGKIEDYLDDYLHINDANLGGRKSNLYVTQEVSQEIEIAKDGSVEKTVTITYKNPEKYDGWLNSVLPNWVRIYVPKGSELIVFDGVEDEEEPYEEYDKTVFAGFFELRPQGVSKVTLKYKLPFKVKKEYKLFIQKQPGTDAPLYTISLDKQEEELFLRTDKEFKFKL